MKAWYMALCFVLLLGCESGSNKPQEKLPVRETQELTVAIACKVLLNDLKVPIDSETAKLLAAQETVYYPESKTYGVNEITFSLNTKVFFVDLGFNPEIQKGPPKLKGVFYQDELGNWKAKIISL